MYSPIPPIATRFCEWVYGSLSKQEDAIKELASLNGTKWDELIRLECISSKNALKSSSETITTTLHTKIKRNLCRQLQDHLEGYFISGKNQAHKLVTKVSNLVPPLLCKRQTTNKRLLFAQGKNLMKKGDEISQQDHSFVTKSEGLIKTTEQWVKSVDTAIALTNYGIFKKGAIKYIAGEAAKINPRTLRKDIDNLIRHIKELGSDERELMHAKRNFIDAFLRVLYSNPNTETLNNFYKRIAKIWLDTSFDKRGSDPKFCLKLGKAWIEKDRTELLVLRAALEELRYCMVGEILELIKKSQISNAAKVYQNLPGRDRRAIEFLLWNHLNEKNPNIDPAEYLSKFFKGELRDNQVSKIIFEVFYKYNTEGQIALRFDMVYRCDESNKGFFFKIKDDLGLTRGYIFGSSHILGKNFSRQPKKILRAFFKSTVFVPELNLMKHKEMDLRTFKDLFIRKGPIHLSCIDAEFFLMAVKQGKRIIDGESIKIREDAEEILSGNSYYKKEMENDPDELNKRTERVFRGGSLRELSALKEWQEDDILPERRKDYELLMFQNRNASMCEIVDRTLNEDETALPFCCFGAGHLVDTQHAKGLITMLSERGWTVQQI